MSQDTDTYAVRDPRTGWLWAVDTREAAKLFILQHEIHLMSWEDLLRHGREKEAK